MDIVLLKTNLYIVNIALFVSLFGVIVIVLRAERTTIL